MLQRNKSLIVFITGLLFSLSFTVYAESVKALLYQANDAVAGNPKGNITVVEFFDYQCSHCMSMAPVIASIIKANPDVRVVFKDLPIRGPLSKFAARAALAAQKQDKYYQVSHALLTTNQPLSEETVIKIAKSTGLDINKLKKDMKSASISNTLNANEKLAQELKLTGTPAFYIGKTDAKNKNDVSFVLGEMSEDELQNAINKAKA
jgi:protein-disulfide isomerase